MCIVVAESVDDLLRTLSCCAIVEPYKIVTVNLFAEYRKIISDVYAKLSGMEKEVFDLALRGYDYKQIAGKLGKDPKAITNALQRIRSKGKGIFQ